MLRKIIALYLLFAITPYLKATKETLKRVEIVITEESLSGGPSEDVRVKAAEYLGIPELKESGQAGIKALRSEFPKGTKKSEILDYLHKIHIQHLKDTELLDYLTILPGDTRPVAFLDFAVKTLTRVRYEIPEINESPEVDILQKEFTCSFQFSDNDELVEVSLSGSSRSYKTQEP